MKNLFKNLMLVAVAAMGFTACEQVIDDVNATNEKFTVNIVGEFADDTRSGFVGSETVGDKTLYKSAWDGSETVRFAIIPDTFADDETATYVDVKNESKGDRATFAPTFGSNVGTIHAFSPKGVYDKNDASACKGGFTSTALTLKYENDFVVVPAEQTPLANSVDPAAHILAGKADFAENVNMTFNHVVAYGKMTIKNFAGAIDKVEVTASESLAGNSCKYYYNEGNLNNANVNTITLNADNVEGNVFWFGCAPADLSEGTLTVKVYSGDDTYTKELAISGKNFKFQQGHVASFGVDMADSEADVKEEVVDPTTLTYTLVTDASTLAVGDKVIIVAKDYTVAMSTAQNTNNRGVVAVTKNDNTIAYVDGLQILTFEAGTKAGTFAFNTGSGYLYAASGSSNQLKTQTTLNDNGSWTIAIAANGVATIKAQGTNTRNWMRFNHSNNPQIFSCYGSGQDDICIYKGVEAGTDEPEQPGEPQPTPLATPEITVSVQNNNNIVVTWSEVVDAASYVVTCTGQTEVTVNSGATLSATFDGLDYDTPYTVTVKALPATDDTMHLESEFATETVTTDPDPNAAPLIADGEYVIIASNAANTVFHALSSEANGSRLNAVEVTFDSTAAVFETPNTSIIWTIKSTNGSYTISNGGKYLHWDSGNSANTNGTAESVVKITESDKEEGRYNIKWGGDDTRLLAKNSGNNYFAFYGGTQQLDLFIVPAEQVEVVAQKLTMSALTISETSNSITVSWNTVANASSYAVKIDSDDELPVNGTSYTFTGLTADTSYNISVVAKGDGVYYLDSDPATTTATTLAAEEPEQPGEGGDGPTYTSYTENFTTWVYNGQSNAENGTVNGNACSWTYKGASKLYWSNISSGSNLSFAITLLKPGSADATYVLSETLSGGIKNLKLTARSNSTTTGVNVYVIDLTTNTTHKVGTLNTTSKKTDFTGEYDLSDLNITGDYQIKIANKSTAAYCCIGGLSWNY